MNEDREAKEYHAIVDLFPLMQGDEFKQLKADVGANGLRESICLHPDGSIIDGRNRYRACIETGVEPRFYTWDGEGSLVDLVVSMNLHRRHLTSSQRAVIALDILPMLEAEARERQGQRTDLIQRVSDIKLVQKYIGHHACTHCFEDHKTGYFVCKATDSVGVGCFETYCQECDQFNFDGDEGWILDAKEKAEEDGVTSDIVQKIAQCARGKARDKPAEIAQTNHQYVSDAKRLRDEAPELLEQVKSGEITIPQAKRKRQKEERERTAANILDNLPEGKYRCIVIDPPWPTQKILREERPNQDIFDYPTMTTKEISRLPIGDLAHEEGCHIYLWTTHKFLPAALDLFVQWGVKYQCLMTWVKPTGMTPFSWMYDTEHVLFGRIGALKLLRMGLKLSFTAPVTKHSEKPGVFYERVCQASPGPRLEMFARKPRDGFKVWGNEV